jgi:large subunit ribosomal protein L24
MPATAKTGEFRTRLRKNDTVEVMSGKDAGKRGKILVVIPKKGRIIVQGAGFIKRHTRPNPSRNIKGGIAEREAPIHVTNVMIVCGDCSARTRVGMKTLEDGRKVRICRKCRGVLDR